MSYKSFTFDGKNSLTDYGVYITGEGVYNSPPPVYDMITVPGRSGNLALSGHRFENYTLEYKCGCFADTQAAFADKIADVRNWLASSAGYKELSDDYHTDEFRLALFHSDIEANPVQHWQAAEFSIIFDCKPQRFLTSGQSATTLTASGTITNPTLFASKPIITVTGNGDLTVGSVTVTIGGTSTTVIDCEMMDCYDSNGTKNSDVTFSGYEFPTLEAGSNTITLGSGITQVDIAPNWWRI